MRAKLRFGIKIEFHSQRSMILPRFLVLAIFLIFGLATAEKSEAETCSDNDPCGFGQLCSNGVCIDSENATCVSRSTKKCFDHNVYWYDSCNVREEKFQDCGLDSYLPEYRCNATMVQQKVIARGCDQAQCKEIRGWIDLQNCADNGLICRDGACQARDTTPPVIYYLLPSGTVTNPKVVLSLTTDEAAECHYGYYDVGFEQMGMKFITADGIHHSVEAALNEAGTYNFYVRCRDIAGNADPASSKISFTYAVESGKTEIKEQTKDTVPPVIESSSLLPTGQVDKATVDLLLKTDERADCRYDIADTAFASMENSFDGDVAGTAHHKSVTLSGAGKYVYYVRCRDTSGNVDIQSSMIQFEYAGGSAEPEFMISDAKPIGTVYQKTVALEVTTSDAANCRYSTFETDFDSMEDFFSTSDGLRHTAMITLGDYGSYTYNAGCRNDDKGTAKIGSTQTTQITFDYKDFNAVETPAVEPAGKCKTITEGIGDGKCSSIQDCICDPDCTEGKNQTDSDCADMPKEKTGHPINWGVWIAAVLVIGALAIILIKKGRGGSDNSIENESEDESLGL